MTDKKPKTKEYKRLEAHTDYFIHIPRSYLRFLWVLPVLALGLFLSQGLWATGEVKFSYGGQDWVYGGYVLTAYLCICLVGYLSRGEKFIVGLIVGLIGGLIAGFIWGLIVGLIAGLIWGFIVGLIVGLTED